MTKFGEGQSDVDKYHSLCRKAQLIKQASKANEAALHGFLIADAKLDLIIFGRQVATNCL